MSTWAGSSNAGDVYIEMLGEGYGTEPCGCNAGYVDCGGTCTDLSSDPNNCSSCGNVCTPPENASATCSGGSGKSSETQRAVLGQIPVSYGDVIDS